MSRDLPIQFPVPQESAVASTKRMSSTPKQRHLSAIPGTQQRSDVMTRSQVATRLGVSISTVRRFEGTRLHPTTDEHDVRWFKNEEVAALASELANAPSKSSRPMVGSSKTTRDAGELAALAFERFEQRQSLAEIVIGLRVEPAVVRTLFDQWCLGLTDAHLRNARTPLSARENEIPRASVETLRKKLASIPTGEVTRISVARFRGPFQHDNVDFADLVELGGFHTGGPCDVRDVVDRFGPGDYRITAFGFTPPALRWEVLVEGL